MPCWVVPSVASEIWHVPVEQILQAVRGGQIPSKSENGFTFIDVAPHAPCTVAPSRPKPPAPIAYKVPRTSGRSDEPIPLPRPAEIITPLEMKHLHATDLNGDADDADPATVTDAPEPLSMGDWRRGRRTAAARRVPPR
jgi:hypothetical protein